MRFSARSLAAVSVTTLLSVGRPPCVVGAQRLASTHSAIEWTVAHDPFADLWFHALAVIAYEGYGPLDLYNAGYAGGVRNVKARANITTTLDRRAQELRRLLTADSAFEVLHFVPLYFVGQDPTLVLSELRAAIRETIRGQGASAITLTARAIAAALPTAQERAAFALLLDAVQDEWSAFLQPELGTHLTADPRAIRELQSAWDVQLAGPLGTYLAAMGMNQGTILISPAVGKDGRIIRRPSGGVIVVVSSEGGSSAKALFSVVRELGFPLLDQLRTPLSATTTRVAAASARDIAAVRAGAIILDAVDTRLAAEYRRAFVDAVGGRAFDEAYPLSNEAEMELRRLVTSAVRGAASGRISYENQ